MTWEFFNKSEFECRCGNCGNEINNEYVDKLNRLRQSLGFPVIITSGYRCPDHNVKVSFSGLDGPHTTGRAADLHVEGHRAFKILSIASNFGFTGIGVKQHGGDRIIHLDDLHSANNRPRPWVWSY